MDQAAYMAAQAAANPDFLDETLAAASDDEDVDAPVPAEQALATQNAAAERLRQLGVVEEDDIDNVTHIVQCNIVVCIALHIAFCCVFIGRCFRSIR
jgi:hypothetical protein